MAETSIKTRIKLRMDLASNWASSTSLIYKGEAALSLGTDNKYEIRIGTSDTGSTWAALASNNLTIPSDNVVGLSSKLYDYQLVEDSTTKGKFWLQKKLPSESTWTNVGSAIDLAFQTDDAGTAYDKSTNKIALKSYVDQEVKNATTAYYEGVRNSGETDAQVIERVIGGITPTPTIKGGSTFVIKTELDGVNGFDASKTVVEGYYHGGKFYEDSEYTVEITGDSTKYYKDLVSGTKYSYSSPTYTALNIAYEYIAFTYDSTTDSANPVWRAMDGNYNAENVYFTKNILATYTIGRYSPGSSGSVTIPTKGKNVYAALDDILSLEKQPGTPTQPAVSVSASNYKAYEVGSNTNALSYSCSLSTGSYTYGPATGITAQSWAVDFNGETTKTSSSGTFTTFRVTDTTFVRLTATATHNAGTVAVTNKGNTSNPVKQIAAGSKTNYSGYITGYRNTFYGAVTEKKTIDSSVIRGLSKTTTSALSSTKLAVGGSVRVIIAIPKTKPSGAQGTYNTCSADKMTKILDENDSNANITGSFSKIEVAVNDANGENPITYSVYYIDFANAHATDNFVITQ